MRTLNIAKGAIAVSLCIVSLLLFKGYMNILNALFIPLALAIFSADMETKELPVLYGVLFLCCFILFPVQVIFVVFYILIAFSIRLYTKKNIRTIIAWLILSLQTALFFTFAIFLTDMVFSTKMLDIMLNTVRGNISIVFAVILFEGIIVAALQLFSYKKTAHLLSKTK